MTPFWIVVSFFLLLLLGTVWRRVKDGSGASGAVHCGGDFSRSSVDGSTDGFGSQDSGSGSNVSGGCGGS